MLNTSSKKNCIRSYHSTDNNFTILPYYLNINAYRSTSNVEVCQFLHRVIPCTTILTS